MRRLVGQALAQAADLRLTGAHWPALQDAIEQIAGMAAVARAAHDGAGYQAALDRLPALERRVGETIDRFMFRVDDEPSGSKSAPALQIQTNPSSLNHVQSDQERSSDPRRSDDAAAGDAASLPPSPSRSVFKARPADLVTMFPSLAMYVTAPRPGWPDLHAAAARLRHDLGIRTSTWVEALDRLGRDGAAVAMMITAERQARGEIRQTAGAYFAGMVVKAGRDELDLGRSLWGFRTGLAVDH